MIEDDIICSRATPAGASAIAVVRVSGKHSHKLLAGIFKPKYSKIDTFKSHKAYYGIITDEDEIIDDVLVITFSEGKSFTGEESFEINCHGSEIVVSLILRLLCRKGARLAEPGEYSKRAFMNGKVDLSEAEAIMDIVNASTKQSAKIAVKQLTGRLKNAVNSIKEELTDLLSEVEVYIDYPEEDIYLDIDKWVNRTLEIKNKSQGMLKDFERGKYLREGITAAILGKTNAGKSTLFNYLLNEDKAIVSDIHGTTRDYLDGVINVSGYGVRVYDTAGLRKTDDPIELEGTKRAIDISDKSDIIIYVIGADNGISHDDNVNISSIRSDKKVLFVINKIDLTTDNGRSLSDEISRISQGNIKDFKISAMSAFNKEGIDTFNKNFLELLINADPSENTDPLITNERHAQLLEESIIELNNASFNLRKEMLDLAAFDIRNSLNKLGNITGEVTTDDILDRIFSNFCVGK